jgi:hypothetical protein
MAGLKSLNLQQDAHRGESVLTVGGVLRSNAFRSFFPLPTGVLFSHFLKNDETFMCTCPSLKDNKFTVLDLECKSQMIYLVNIVGRDNRLRLPASRSRCQSAHDFWPERRF